MFVSRPTTIYNHYDGPSTGRYWFTSQQEWDKIMRVGGAEFDGQC